MSYKVLTKGNKKPFKSLIHLSFWTFATTILQFGIRILKNAIITRLLGPTNRGVYGLVTLIPQIIINVGNMGLGISNVYHISKKHYHLGKVMGTTFVFAFFLSLVLVGICAKVIFMEGVLESILKDDAKLLEKFVPIILVSIPLLLIWGYGKAFLVALKKIKSFNIFRIFESSFPLFFFILLYLVTQDALQAAVKSWILSIFIICIICFLTIKDHQAYPLKFSKNYLKEGLSFGLRGHFSNIFHMLLLRVDFFFVSSLLGVEALGYYTVSVSLGELLLFLPQSVVLPFIPILLGLKQSDAEKFTPIVTRCILFIMILACIALGLTGKLIIYILFGKQFFPSLNPLLYLLPGMLALSIFPILRTALINENKPGTISLISGLALFCNLILNYFLIPKWGINGAAISSSISYGLAVYLLLLIYLRQSNQSLKDVIIPKYSDMLMIKYIITKDKKDKIDLL